MLSQVITRRRASSIAEVVDIMTALERELSRSDGLWWFNHLYLRVTLAVRGAVTTTTFRDPAFLERLDLVFACSESDCRGHHVAILKVGRIQVDAVASADSGRISSCGCRKRWLARSAR